jgi:hypothetical protein
MIVSSIVRREPFSEMAARSRWMKLEMFYTYVENIKGFLCHNFEEFVLKFVVSLCKVWSTSVIYRN